MKFLKSPYFIITCIVLILITWFWTGKPTHTIEVKPQPAPMAPQVGIIHSHAVPHPIYYTFNGKTEAARKVVLKSRIHSVVTQLVAKEGAPIEEGQIILKLAIDDRVQQLKKAKALVEQRDLEYKAATKLAAKQFISATGLADKKTLFEQAKMELQNKALEFSNTFIKTPFKGVLNDYVVHEGDAVQPGSALATVVELDPLFVKIYVNEQSYANIHLDQPAEVHIQEMEPLTGHVEYIAAVADPQTHTFECHIRIQNPNYRVPVGMSSTIKIMGLQPQPMHKLPSVALSLDDAGRVGVETVEGNNVVGFYPIQVMESNAQEVWAQGLPDSVDVIVVGQEFVKPGETVRVVEQSTEG